MAMQSYLYFALLFLLSQHLGSANQESSTPNEAADDKLCLEQKALATGRLLAERYHDDAVLSNEDFRHLLTDVEKSLHNYGAADFKKRCTNNTEAEVKTDGMNVNCSECPSIDEIYSRHSEEDGGLHHQRLAVALQEAVFTSTNPKCHFTEERHKGSKPTTGQAWGYGIGFVTLVVIISNIGALLTPFMSRTFFQRLLQFLVAMGAGTLVATGLLVLLPEAFDIVSVEELSEDFVWKSATAIFSIYVFFISERFLKFLLKSREMKNIRRNESLHIEPGMGNDSEKHPMAPPSAENGPPDHGHSHFVTATEGKGGPVATVAWMVLIGDVMHNFVDGMAIGAAFTENKFLGVSIGIAVLCEELPHELGDVAILLHSGMTMKRAVFLNFLSACVCYVGLVIGILLGENTEANRWILAVAGGLFLYVPLVDMLPDMSQHLDMKVREGTTSQSKRTIPREAWFILICQSVGLLLGMCIILTVVNFTGMIELGH